MITANKLIDIINTSGVDRELSISDSNSSFEELGLDSLDVFNIMVQIQEEMGKDIPDEDVERLQSIQEILNYLRS